jgi:hypothetical protein
MTFEEEVDHLATILGALTPKQRECLVALLKALKEEPPQD